MPGTYSTYEAKAKLSELLRKVRAGETVLITHRGEPIAEVRPVEPGPETMDTRRRRLVKERRIVAARGPGDFGPIARKPGALKRFLAERD